MRAEDTAQEPSPRAKPDRTREESSEAVEALAVRANLRLVFSVAKLHLGPRDELPERVSEGNLVMLRAVERFDYVLGNKFSTYATWAIRNHLARAARRKGRLPQFVLGRDEAFDAAVDPRTGDLEQSDFQAQRREAVARSLARLSDRERRVIAGRFGIGGGRAQTLRQLGSELGVTKERVRQIQAWARDKFRELARAEEPVLLTA